MIPRSGKGFIGAGRPSGRAFYRKKAIFGEMTFSFVKSSGPDHDAGEPACYVPAVHDAVVEAQDGRGDGSSRRDREPGQEEKHRQAGDT